MNQRKYYFYAGVIFAIIALAHLTRVIYAWQAVVNGISIPFWVSWIAIVLTGYMAYRGFELSKTR